jgi:hypothetical protein
VPLQPIFQLCYCVLVQPVFQLCYCVLVQPIFQLWYCTLSHQSFSCVISPTSFSHATAYISHQYSSCAAATYLTNLSAMPLPSYSPIFQLRYCLHIFQAAPHNLHILYILLFLWNISMLNFYFYYNYLQNTINHEHSLCSLILIRITFTRLISFLGTSDFLKSFCVF